MEFTIDELTALTLTNGRAANHARKAAELLLKVAEEHDHLAQIYLEAGKRIGRETEAKESKVKLRGIITSMMVLILVGVLMMGSLTLAQDVTPDAVATEPVTSVITDYPADVTPGTTQQPAEKSSEVVYFTWTALAGLISIVLTVGLAGGAGGAVVIIKAVRQNDTIKFAMEKLYQSASPETQRLIRSTVEVAKEGVELADEITDGQLPSTT